MKHLVFSKEKNKTQNNFDKMNIAKKEWFCFPCSIQFDSKHVYSLHLKLLHKDMILTKSIIKQLESYEPVASEEMSISSNQIATHQNERKTFDYKNCQYSFTQRDHLNVHIASIREENKPLKCKFCNYTCFTKKTFE